MTKKSVIVSWLLGGLLWCSPASAQLWSGYLDSERGIDWQNTLYVPPDTTSWTQCGNTIAAYGTSVARQPATTINNVIAGCTANQYVLLGPGTFYLNSMIDLTGRDSFVLRGSGPTSTIINSTSTGGCTGTGGTIICVRGEAGEFFNDSDVTTHSITSGVAQDATAVVVDSASGLYVGQVVYVEQLSEDLAGSYAPFFICDGLYNSCVNAGSGNSHSTVQAVVITNIAGTTVTFAPKLYYSRWSQSLSPRIEYFGGASGNVGTTLGVENMQIAWQGQGGQMWGVVYFYNVNGGWVKNVTVNTCPTAGACLGVHYSTNIAIFNNYLFAAHPRGISLKYGINVDISTNVAIYNNICQRVQACYMNNGNGVGTIVAYNFARNQPWDGLGNNNSALYPDHAQGASYTLLEGNDVNGISFDLSHGTGCCHTAVRNVLHGRGYDETLLTYGNTQPIVDRAFDRFVSLFGNVLGEDGRHTLYQSYPGAPSGNIALTGYDIGWCNGIENLVCTGYAPSTSGDIITKTSLYRWGNYDTVSDTTHWCGTSSNTNWGVALPTGCSSATEVPTDQSVPATETVPASFYLTSKPSWFGSVTWPPIGPDVTGGSITGYGGRAHRIPARVCYEDIMGGPVNGYSSLLTFDAETCYGSTDSTPPAAPTGVTISWARVNP